MILRWLSMMVARCGNNSHPTRFLNWNCPWRKQLPFHLKQLPPLYPIFIIYIVNSVNFRLCKFHTPLLLITCNILHCCVEDMMEQHMMIIVSGTELSSSAQQVKYCISRLKKSRKVLLIFKDCGDIIIEYG